MNRATQIRDDLVALLRVTDLSDEERAAVRGLIDQIDRDYVRRASFAIAAFAAVALGIGVAFWLSM